MKYRMVLGGDEFLGLNFFWVGYFFEGISLWCRS